MENSRHILSFDKINITGIEKVGGKNASLGKMYNQLNSLGINIANAFALTAAVYRLFRKENNIEAVLTKLLLSLDSKNYSNLAEIGEKTRKYILSARLSTKIKKEIHTAYQSLCEQSDIENLGVAVLRTATPRFADG